MDSILTQIADHSTKVYQQEENTCYAHAIATVIRAAEARILGRKLQRHSDIVNELIRRWGENGAVLSNVLMEECPKRQLRYKEIDSTQCCEVLKNNEPVLAAFYLDQRQWSNLMKFFEGYPEGVITKKVIGKPLFLRKENFSGHGVVIVGQTDFYWKVKNSWGRSFGDNGFFRMAKDAIDFQYYFHVYSNKKDLSPKDKAKEAEKNHKEKDVPDQKNDNLDKPPKDSARQDPLKPIVTDKQEKRLKQFNQQKDMNERNPLRGKQFVGPNSKIDPWRGVEFRLDRFRQLPIENPFYFFSPSNQRPNSKNADLDNQFGKLNPQTPKLVSPRFRLPSLDPTNPPKIIPQINIFQKGDDFQKLDFLIPKGNLKNHHFKKPHALPDVIIKNQNPVEFLIKSPLTAR